MMSSRVGRLAKVFECGNVTDLVHSETAPVSERKQSLQDKANIMLEKRRDSEDTVRKRTKSGSPRERGMPSYTAEDIDIFTEGNFQQNEKRKNNLDKRKSRSLTALTKADKPKIAVKPTFFKKNKKTRRPAKNIPKPASNKAAAKSNVIKSNGEKGDCQSKDENSVDSYKKIDNDVQQSDVGNTETKSVHEKSVKQQSGKGRVRYENVGLHNGHVVTEEGEQDIKDKGKNGDETETKAETETETEAKQTCDDVDVFGAPGDHSVKDNAENDSYEINSNPYDNVGYGTEDSGRKESLLRLKNKTGPDRSTIVPRRRSLSWPYQEVPGSVNDFFEKLSDIDDLSDSFDESDDDQDALDDNTPKESKLHQIVRELLSTEKSYVNRLKLVDQIFHFEIAQANKKYSILPPSDVGEMFKHIKGIYQLHNEHLMPQLQKRLDNWEADCRIGDIMKNFAPFLKMYTEYAKNFDHAMNLINEWSHKSSKFATLLKEIQRKPECNNLTLQHHMLEPIQRVPRYELLLKDYLKHLPEDSLDKADAEIALSLVTKAAVHSNDTMKNREHFQKLLDISHHLGDSIDIISPTRQLVKEGRVTKISARGGGLLERYAFLFNDLFLLCSMLAGISHSYKIKARLDIDGMEILEGDNLETPNTFHVRSKTKNVELHFGSQDEKTEWHIAFVEVTQKYNRAKQKWQKTLMSSGGTEPEVMEDDEVGKRAPTWVKDSAVSMCMSCSVTFTPFRRRHHCRACGWVVCGVCSRHTSYLEFSDKTERVCIKCKRVLLHNELSGGKNDKKRDGKRKGPLDVKASDPCVYSGYMHLSADNGKTWNKRWFSVRDDYVMYCFKAHKDVQALTSTPLPGYHVDMVSNEEIDRDYVFKLSHDTLNSVYLFQCDQNNLFTKWTAVLEKLVQADLPIWVVRETVKRRENKITVRRKDKTVLKKQ